MANYILSNELHEVVQYPYSIAQLQIDNQNTSFPRGLVNKLDVLSTFYVFPVSNTEKPSYDPRIEVVEEMAPERVNGVWEQRWNVRSASTSEQSTTAATLRKTFSDMIQQRLDQFAQTRNYSSILSAVSYEDDINPIFAQEAADAKRLRSETWTAAYQLLAEVESGERSVPSGIGDIEADLPVLTWTE